MHITLYVITSTAFIPAFHKRSGIAWLGIASASMTPSRRFTFNDN
jgi:hypothetical protein